MQIRQRAEKRKKQNINPINEDIVGGRSEAITIKLNQVERERERKRQRRTDEKEMDHLTDLRTCIYYLKTTNHNHITPSNLSSHLQQQQNNAENNKIQLSTSRKRIHSQIQPCTNSRSSPQKI